MKKTLAFIVCISFALFPALSATKTVDVTALGTSRAFTQTAAEAELSAQTSDYEVNADNVELYGSGSSVMTIENGALISNADGEQKTMFKKDVFYSRNLEVSWSMSPTTRMGEINGGVYFFADRVGSSYASIYGLSVTVKHVEGEPYYQVFLRSFLGRYINDEQKTGKQRYDGDRISLKLLVDDEDIYLYIGDSDVPSMTKRVKDTSQTGAQIGFRSYNAAMRIDDITVSDTPVKPNVKTVKMLMIGNSFAQDAMTYVHEIARADGVNFIAGALFYGGCRLDQHYDFVRNNENVYTLFKNGITDETNVTFFDAIYDEDWDIITFQNTSTLAGVYETWYPYISYLVSLTETLLPNVEIGIHFTWASSYFMQGRNDRKLENYNDSTDVAHRMAKAMIPVILEETGTEFIVPCGEAVYAMHGTEVCDATSLATSFNRDETCHLNEKGRYLVAGTVYRTVTGRPFTGNTFAPYGHSYGSDDGPDQRTREVSQRVADKVFTELGYPSLNWFDEKVVLEKLDVTAVRMAYKEGEYFDYKHTYVTAYYSDGTKEDTKLFTIDLRRPLKTTDTNIVVSYRGKSVTIPIIVT